MDKIKMIKDWKNHFQDVSNLHRFPLDTPEGNLSVDEIKNFEFKINRELYSRLNNFCQESDYSLFSVFFTAWTILFNRYTGQNDIAMGLYRPQIAGLKNDVVPIVSHLESHEPFVSALIKNIEFFKTIKYQLAATSEIFETLKIDPTQKYHPLYQAQFSFYDNSTSTITPNHNINLKPSHSLGSVPLDLELKIYCSSNECSLDVYYSSGIINSSTIKNIIHCFEKLIESILETPNNEISSLDILPNAEQNKILIDWNDTARDFPQDNTLHQLFEEQVKKTPNNVALVYKEQQLTYRELNKRSNQLAHYLRTQGVCAETLVAIACERSLEMIIGMIGILKAGGAYVPMDPAFPRERLEYMLEDTKTSVLLTQSWLKEKLPRTEGLVIELDHMDELIGEYPVGNLELLTKPDNLAYVIYTSGSTGKPKGVLSLHRGCINRMLWLKDYFEITSEDRFLQKTPYTFDISVCELFTGLLSGAQLIICNPEGHKDPYYITDLVNRHKITIIYFVPSMLNLFIANEENFTYPSLKKIICGGESLSFDLAMKTLHKFKTIRLLNGYGPTETSIDSSYYEVNAATANLKLIPIGKPIWNTSLYILNNSLKPVPIGVIGELYIGGEGLARGYLNNPELTAERFIENPFASKEEKEQNCNTRIYRTGDLCRYLEDGSIEYIGRIDHQVKIRGFRIELGEIEANLLSHPAVQEAAVLAWEDEPDNKRLVAYYVVTPGVAIEPNSLRDYLKSSLPDYMIPSFFVPLKAMPLSPNGKLNRKALPIPEGDEIRQEYMTAHTPTEKALVEIWQNILRIDRVGVNDNFFEMGGDSLKSFRVISRIKRQHNIEIPYRYFFENPTISELSNYIDNNIKDKNINPLVKVSRDQIIPVSFNQLPLLLDEIYVGNLIFVSRLEGDLNYSAFEESINQIVQRHEALRSAVILPENNGDLPIQKIAQHLTIKMNHIDLTVYSEEEKQTKLNNFIEYDARKSFDLSTAPLFRCHLIKKNKNEHLFIFTIDHIFFDLESLGILFKEISELYNAKVLGTQPELPALPIQWADFSLWQWEYLKGAKLKKHLSYWIENLKNSPMELELPIDYPRKIKSMHDIVSGLRWFRLITKVARHFVKREVIQRMLIKKDFEGTQYFFEIPRELSKGLKKLSEEQNVTLYMTLLTAFNVLIYGYNSQEDIIIGSPFSNRNRVETEGVIGYFVNFLPLRTNLKGNPTFNQLLKRVKNVTLNAYDYQYVPWVQLSKHFIGQEDSILLNVGRLMFGLEQNLFNNLSLEGIISNREAYETSFCECELILIVQENAEDLSGCFKYRTNLFKKETIEQMSKKFLTLLKSIVNNPETGINQLNSLSEGENYSNSCPNQILPRIDDNIPRSLGKGK